ncbi:protein of unknown function [Paraburkholderia dioscoreae]|uniref:Uncharacterized protein n=1 Tax=Paraburkholderia dioscoreae TaxID=2604047 RepID=A0A5Q4YTB6_9BURK|nr:protein of unknown function [Paraburkholderia dioscoreae]
MDAARRVQNVGTQIRGGGPRTAYRARPVRYDSLMREPSAALALPILFEHQRRSKEEVHVRTRLQTDRTDRFVDQIDRRRH